MWRGNQTPATLLPADEQEDGRIPSTIPLDRGAIQGAYMALAVRNEGSKVNSNINVTPMVDVMLVLLIIFMVITPMVQNKVNVDLTKSIDATPMPDADHEDSVVVAITRDGRVFLGANQMASADLGPKITDMLQNKTNKEVYMRADTRANYGVVMDAIDNIRTSGTDTLGVLTDQPNNGTAGGMQ
jgi:biopolymer transport protein TolR